VKICGSSIGEVTVATTNADGSMRNLSDILADCRTAFSGLTESEKASAAESLVGKNAMSGFLALMNAGEGDINKLSGAIDGCDGTAQKMADTMNNNLAGQLTILKSQLEELAISFGEILLPAVKNIVGFLQGFVDMLNKLPDGVKQTIVTIALIAAALGPVLIIVGKVITAVGTIMTAIPKLVGAFNAVKTAFAALSAVLAANPIILIVAAVAAAIAAVVLLYQKCEWFRDAVNAVWQAVSDFFVKIWNGIISFFTVTIPAAWNSVVAFFQGIPEWWSNLWSSIRDFFGKIWTGMMNNPVLSAITTLIQNLWKNLVTTLQGIWTGLTTIASGAFELLKNVILGPVLLLIDLVTRNFTKLKEDATKIWTNIQTAASQIWSGIRQVVGSLAQGLATHVSTLITGLKDILSNLWSSMASTASNLWTSLKNTVINLAGNIRDSAVIAFKNLVSGIGNALSGLGSVVQNGFQSAISFITSLPGKALEWGADFINGIARGIRNAIGNVADAVGSVAEKIRSVLHFSVPDEGPLTDYESWMPDFMRGLAKGIDQSKHLVTQAMKGVAQNMVINPKMGAMDMAMAGSGSVSSADLGSLTGAIREAVSDASGSQGDIVIPVYLGGTLLDEVIVNAQQRSNLRSGGR
jgi:phage-related protein